MNTLLAMVAAIFLPLTFLCGVYGMNFNTNEGAVAIPLLRLGDGFGACLCFCAWPPCVNPTPTAGGYVMYWVICAAFIVCQLVVFIQFGWFRLVGLRPAIQCNPMQSNSG